MEAEVKLFLCLQAEKLMRQIGVKNVKLSEYEMSIAAHLVDPLSMQVSLYLIITDLKQDDMMVSLQH